MFDIIFDTLFDFLSAWDMLGLLLMGTVFIIIGSTFIGYEIYWRLKSEKVHGIISAVKEKGQYYYAVFKYKTQEGRTFEQDSNLGSSSIINRLPGTKLTVMILPNNPEKVRRPTLIWFLFGSVFLMPGLFIMNLAINKFEFNYMVALFIFAILLFGGQKLFNFYKKITKSEFDKTLLKEAWKDIKSGRKPRSKSKKINGRILENNEILEKVNKHFKHTRITILFLIALAIGMFWGVHYTGQNMLNLMQNGVTANGVVTDFKSDYASDGGGYTYYAIVKFTAQNGEEYKFTDTFGSSTKLFKREEEVDILYFPSSPRSAIIDRGIFNWAITLGLIILALCSLWGAFVFLKARRRFQKTSFYSTIQVRP